MKRKLLESLLIEMKRPTPEAYGVAMGRAEVGGNIKRAQKLFKRFKKTFHTTDADYIDPAYKAIKSKERLKGRADSLFGKLLGGNDRVKGGTRAYKAGNFYRRHKGKLKAVAGAAAGVAGYKAYQSYKERQGPGRGPRPKPFGLESSVKLPTLVLLEMSSGAKAGRIARDNFQNSVTGQLRNTAAKVQGAAAGRRLGKPYPDIKKAGMAVAGAGALYGAYRAGRHLLSRRKKSAPQPHNRIATMNEA